MPAREQLTSRRRWEMVRLSVGIYAGIFALWAAAHFLPGPIAALLSHRGAPAIAPTAGAARPDEAVPHLPAATAPGLAGREEAKTTRNADQVRISTLPVSTRREAGGRPSSQQRAATGTVALSVDAGSRPEGGEADAGVVHVNRALRLSGDLTPAEFERVHALAVARGTVPETTPGTRTLPGLAPPGSQPIAPAIGGPVSPVGGPSALSGVVGAGLPGAATGTPRMGAVLPGGLLH